MTTMISLAKTGFRLYYGHTMHWQLNINDLDGKRIFAFHTDIEPKLSIERMSHLIMLMATPMTLTSGDGRGCIIPLNTTPSVKREMLDKINFPRY